MKGELALRRESLLRRSQLARVQLRREARVVRESVRWTRTAATVARAPLARRAALGLALTLLGASRASRLLKFAGRAVLAIQLGRALLAARSK